MSTTTKTSRSDWRVASAWLDSHRLMAALVGVLATVCVIVLLLSMGSPSKRVIGVPLFAAIAAYMFYKALRKAEAPE